MSIVLLCFGDALGAATKMDGQYLVACDFEADGGYGVVVTTPNIADAKRFESVAEAFEFYKTSPKCHPVRTSDGKPNRPLTAYNWKFFDPDKPA